MRRALIAVVLCLLAFPAGAAAQSNPFGPLPPAQQPTPEPTAAPQNPADQSGVSVAMLLGIAGGVALLFIGIGLYITRDARRRLTESDRHQIEHRGEQTERHRREAAKAKQKARARAKAQRQARKKQRR